MSTPPSAGQPQQLSAFTLPPDTGTSGQQPILVHNGNPATGNVAANGGGGGLSQFVLPGADSGSVPVTTAPILDNSSTSVHSSSGTHLNQQHQQPQPQIVPSAAPQQVLDSAPMQQPMMVLPPTTAPFGQQPTLVQLPNGQQVIQPGFHHHQQQQQQQTMSTSGTFGANSNTLGMSGSQTMGGSTSSTTTTESCKLYIRNLPPSITEQIVREYFGAHGEIVSMQLTNERAGTGFCCYVTYKDDATAKAALRATCGQAPFNDPTVGALPLNVRFAESLESRNARLINKKKKQAANPPPPYAGSVMPTQPLQMSGSFNSQTGQPMVLAAPQQGIQLVSSPQAAPTANQPILMQPQTAGGQQQYVILPNGTAQPAMGQPMVMQQPAQTVPLQQWTAPSQ